LCLHFENRINLGSFSEMLAVPQGIAETYTFPVPEAVPSRRALFLQSLACVEHGLRMARLEPGEKVLIQGIGCLGLLFALSAREKGTAVTLSGKRLARRDLAKSCGFDTADVEVSGLATIFHRGHEGGPDVVIDAAGTALSWNAAVESVRPGGRVLFFGGLPASAQVPLHHQRVHYQEIQLISTFHYCPPDVAAAKDLLWSGRLAPEAWLTDTDLACLPEAFETLERGDVLKYAVSPTGLATP
jgi:L-iditol 2-dehydrogenase